MVGFLQKCKELPTEGRSEAELQEQVEKLKKEVEARNNVYIKALLAKVQLSDCTSVKGRRGMKDIKVPASSFAVMWKLCSIHCSLLYCTVHQSAVHFT